MHRILLTENYNKPGPVWLGGEVGVFAYFPREYERTGPSEIVTTDPRAELHFVPGESLGAFWPLEWRLVVEWARFMRNASQAYEWEGFDEDVEALWARVAD